VRSFWMLTLPEGGSLHRLLCRDALELDEVVDAGVPGTVSVDLVAMSAGVRDFCGAAIPDRPVRPIDALTRALRRVGMKRR
jgi:hypothetical protein